MFAVQNNWVDAPPDISVRVRTDLAALRSVPGVVDAYVTNAYPLSNLGGALPVTLDPGDQASWKRAQVYLAGPHAFQTLGLRLIAGRSFTPEDVQDLGGPFNAAHERPGGVIVTKELAEQLSPGGHVLGRLTTIRQLGGQTEAPIVGIVQDLQVAMINPPEFLHLPAYSSMLVPYRYTGPTAYYVVQARSAALMPRIMQAAIASLYAISRDRVLQNAETLPEARRRVYRSDRSQTIMLTAVSAILLAMTGWAIVGITSCWVNQRRRQIGIRRALGATHAAIVRHFQAENLLIASAGVAAGLGLAIGGNLWMISRFQMDRLDYRYAALGAVIVLLLGQLATLWPALRAASVPPAEAARTA